MNGANLRWPEELGLDLGVNEELTKDVWVFALINASPYLFASMV